MITGQLNQLPQSAITFDISQQLSACQIQSEQLLAQNKFADASQLIIGQLAPHKLSFSVDILECQSELESLYNFYADFCQKLINSGQVNCAEMYYKQVLKNTHDDKQKICESSLNFHYKMAMIFLDSGKHNTARICEFESIFIASCLEGVIGKEKSIKMTFQFADYYFVENDINTAFRYYMEGLNELFYLKNKNQLHIHYLLYFHDICIQLLNKKYASHADRIFQKVFSLIEKTGLSIRLEQLQFAKNKYSEKSESKNLASIAQQFYQALLKINQTLSQNILENEYRADNTYAILGANKYLDILNATIREYEIFIQMYMETNAREKTSSNNGYIYPDNEIRQLYELIKLTRKISRTALNKIVNNHHFNDHFIDRVKLELGCAFLYTNSLNFAIQHLSSAPAYAIEYRNYFGIALQIFATDSLAENKEQNKEQNKTNTENSASQYLKESSKCLQKILPELNSRYGQFHPKVIECKKALSATPFSGF